MVPIILYAFRIEKISLRIWISVLLAFIGIQMISPDGFNVGDKLTFGCALSFAIHVIFQDRYLGKGVNMNHFYLTQVIFNYFGYQTS